MRALGREAGPDAPSAAIPFWLGTSRMIPLAGRRHCRMNKLATRRRGLRNSPAHRARRRFAATPRRGQGGGQTILDFATPKASPIPTVPSTDGLPKRASQAPGVAPKVFHGPFLAAQGPPLPAPSIGQGVFEMPFSCRGLFPPGPAGFFRASTPASAGLRTEESLTFALGRAARRRIGAGAIARA
jgi:hypothetical protein